MDLYSKLSFHISLTLFTYYARNDDKKNHRIGVGEKEIISESSSCMKCNNNSYYYNYHKNI